MQKTLKCPAFPYGIPEEILNGENDHTKPLWDQKHNIVFEPIKKETKRLFISSS